MSLYPDLNAPVGTTWADGYGRWHCIAVSEEGASVFIKRELVARDYCSVRAIIRVRKHEDQSGTPYHWVEQ